MDIEGSGVIGGFDKKKNNNTNNANNINNTTAANNPLDWLSRRNNLSGIGKVDDSKRGTDSVTVTPDNVNNIGANFNVTTPDKSGVEGDITIPQSDIRGTGLTFNTTPEEEEEETDPYALTDQQRIAARNQTNVSNMNRDSVWRQLSRQLATYDYADAQNRALADAQRIQNSRKNSVDRFEAQRDLQSAALGVLGSMGNSMNGSALGNLMRMLESRNDKENNTYLSQLQQNQDAVENAYQDALNQNNVNRLDARNSADKAADDIYADWYANLNNINPKLHDQYWGYLEGKEPENGQTETNRFTTAEQAMNPDIVDWSFNASVPQTFTGGTPGEALSSYQYDLSYLGQQPEYPSYRGYTPSTNVSGYAMPDNTVRSTGAQANPSRVRNAVGPYNDYFAEMMNRFNGYNTMRRR